ncbi:hypothetical protein C6A85_79505 [Mycobacterium sp. ITM-2017-0098]|nr:hypothetical protein C6A85_79505 [Mycobacterium sp. ITM-2017-0098]
MVFRELFTDMAHPMLDQTMPTETAPAVFTRIPRAALRPAPMPGEHTYGICRRVLGLSTDQIDGLISDGALFAYEKKS